MKINDKFKLPLFIDLNNFMRDYLKIEMLLDNAYKLNAIVIHEGLAQIGHYYYLIYKDNL